MDKPVIVNQPLATQKLIAPMSLFRFTALACLIPAAFQNPVSAAEQRVASPDGKLALVVSDEGGLNYRVSLDGNLLLVKSALGLQFAGNVVLGPSAAIKSVTTSDHRGKWENRFGKRRWVTDQWNEIRITLEEGGTPARRFVLVARAYDDGVAFRYDLPKESNLEEFTLTKELTEFSFPQDHTCWAGEPSSCAENNYPETKLTAIPQKDASGKPYLSTLPMVVREPKAFVAIAESDLLDWAGMFLTGSGQAKVSVSLAARGDGRGCVVAKVPCQSPWRVLMIGRSEKDLVLSDLIANLATPSRIADASWVRPGVSAWDAWWTGLSTGYPENVGLFARSDTASHKEFIDLAAEMGWPYKLVDWFWYENMTSYDITLNLNRQNPPRPPVDLEKCVPNVDLPELFTYAKSKNVRLFVWLHSYDMHRYGIEKTSALFERMGAAGLKIDFMNDDGQETVRWYQEVLETAARHKLMIDFHGAYKATGLARTWPNYITQEGVLGNEYNKIPDAKFTPQHGVTLPFTRGLLGPMDVTPGGFINKTVKDFQITHPAQVIGTRARQLAMTVIYESPLLVLCDSPANYKGAPGVEFFRGLPTVWDDSVVPSAEMARHIVIARKSGDRWWLAAMNGDKAIKLRIPLAFLGSGQWSMRAIADIEKSATHPEALGETERRLESSETLEIELAPVGGYAATFSPAK